MKSLHAISLQPYTYKGQLVSNGLVKITIIAEPWFGGGTIIASTQTKTNVSIRTEKSCLQQWCMQSQDMMH